MATAFLGKTEIKVKETGRTVTVPSDPTARLMYYFDCICSCIKPDDSSAIRRLRDYNNYERLSNDEKNKLLAIVLTLSPDKLIGQVIFPSDDLGSSSNRFLELSAVSTNLVVSESILIGGQRQKVQKIMMFKKSWIEKYYIEPLRSIDRARSRPPPRPKKNDDCMIM